MRAFPSSSTAFLTSCSTILAFRGWQGCAGGYAAPLHLLRAKPTSQLRYGGLHAVHSLSPTTDSNQVNEHAIPPARTMILNQTGPTGRSSMLTFPAKQNHRSPPRRANSSNLSFCPARDSITFDTIEGGYNPLSAPDHSQEPNHVSSRCPRRYLDGQAPDEQTRRANSSNLSFCIARNLIIFDTIQSEYSPQQSPDHAQIPCHLFWRVQGQCRAGHVPGKAKAPFTTGRKSAASITISSSGITSLRPRSSSSYRFEANSMKVELPRKQKRH